jgi:hypothetical protein
MDQDTSTDQLLSFTTKSDLINFWLLDLICRAPGQLQAYIDSRAHHRRLQLAGLIDRWIYETLSQEPTIPSGSRLEVIAVLREINCGSDAKVDTRFSWLDNDCGTGMTSLFSAKQQKTTRSL